MSVILRRASLEDSQLFFDLRTFPQFQPFSILKLKLVLINIVTGFSQE